MSAPLGLASFHGVIKYDIKVVMRCKSEVLTSLSFFVIVISLITLGVSAERDMLRQIAPGILWIAALLATLISLNRLFERDYLDGTLDQLLLSPAPLGVLILRKV